jgi:hypothetical protein
MFARLWSATLRAVFRNPLSRRLGWPLAALHVWFCSNTLSFVEWHPKTRRLDTATESEGNEFAAYVVGFMQGSLLIYPMYATATALVFRPQSALSGLLIGFVSLVTGAAASQITDLATLPAEAGDLNDRGIVETGG